MQIECSFRAAAIAPILLLALGIVQVQAETDSVAHGSTNAETGAERIIGNRGKFLAKTKIVAADTDLVEKAVHAKNVMKEIRRSSLGTETGPQTIEEAAALLSHRINMACPPTKCFEHEGVFYFSGGVSAKPVDDFSSGLAVKKGDATIYEWTESDTPQERKSK